MAEMRINVVNALYRLSLVPIAALLAVGATAATEPAIAGFEPLIARSSDAALCSRDHVWCVTAPSERSPLVVRVKGKDAARWAPGTQDDTIQLKPLPQLLRLPDGSALVPVEVRAQAMYSGGGGEFTTLRLLLVRPGKAPRSVLNLPWKTDLMIRACFSDKDAKARAGACHDEYQFDGQLTAVKPMKSRFPTLAYLASAQSYPRGISRNVDSLTLPPLKKSDLVWVSDRACSYRRTFRFDPASQRYKPNAPLPACDQYSSR